MEVVNIGVVLTALGLGFFGSPHCLGMCGGVVMAFGLSMQGVSPAKKRLIIASYHLGRLTSYALLGAVGAMVGASVLSPFMTDNALPRILLGVSLVFCALLMMGLPMLKSIEKVGLGLWQKLAPMRAKLFPLNSIPKALMAGLLWGFLPCGLVYGAILVAVGLGAGGFSGVVLGAGFMVLFGLGTMPLLLTTQGGATILQKITQKISLRYAGGVLMLLSGLAVGIHPFFHAHHHHAQHGHAHHAHTHHNHSTSHNSSEHHHNHHHTHNGEHSHTHSDGHSHSNDNGHSSHNGHSDNNAHSHPSHQHNDGHQHSHSH